MLKVQLINRAHVKWNNLLSFPLATTVDPSSRKAKTQKTGKWKQLPLLQKTKNLKTMHILII